MKRKITALILVSAVILTSVGLHFLLSDGGLLDYIEQNKKTEAKTYSAKEMVKKTAKWRDETDKRIEEIRNSPNMEIPEDATVYYVSSVNGSDLNDGLSPETAFETLGAVHSTYLAEGDYVCLERGSIFRGGLAARRGVTYTAYGKGEKPKVYRSPLDAADPTVWKKTDAENIWSIQLTDADVGTLVFNGGDSCAVKAIIRYEEDGSTYNNTTGKPFKTYKDLCDDLHFYHDYKNTGLLYLYSEQNPGERFLSIEINSKGNVVSFDGDNVTIDNLCIKYGGSHGVGGGTAKNITVTNCEFGWIGGSIQTEAGGYGRNYATRFGNAVEIYGGCDGFKVTDNYIYQVYDAGITQQVNLGGKADNINYQKNMDYSRNVMEYCNYSIEYFLAATPTENPSRMENFKITDNYMWYAGLGFCEQRPDHDQAAHIKSWAGGSCNRATNYVIKNNLFAFSRDMLAELYSSLKNPDGTDGLPTLQNNHFLNVKDAQFGVFSTDVTERQKYNEKIVDYLGDKSKADTLWMTNGNFAFNDPKTQLREENGEWYYYKDGKKTADTGLIEYAEKGIYLNNGKWDRKATKLAERGGKQYYIENGIWKKATHKVIEMDKIWYYLKNENADELVELSGEWLYIKNGLWDNTINTIYEKDSKQYAIKGGKWCKDKAIIAHDGQQFYADGGFVKYDFSGEVEIDSQKYTIEYGVVV